MAGVCESRSPALLLLSSMILPERDGWEKSWRQSDFIDSMKSSYESMRILKRGKIKTQVERHGDQLRGYWSTDWQLEERRESSWWWSSSPSSSPSSSSLSSSSKYLVLPCRLGKPSRGDKAIVCKGQDGVNKDCNDDPSSIRYSTQTSRVEV